MAGYLGTKAVFLSTTAASVGGDATIGGDLTVGDGLTVDNDGATVLTVDRATSDGTLVDFQKNGTSVGSIGATGGDLHIGTGITGIRFRDGIDAVGPSSGTVGTDAATDLGATGNRFKNLYLSGGVYLGGTGSANKLDDYEEGTWTPVLTSTSGTIAVQGAFNTLNYTKVGRVVTLTGRFRIGSMTGVSGFIAINLPFTAAANVEGSGFAALTLLTHGTALPAGTISTFAEVNPNSTEATFYAQKDNASWVAVDASGFANGDIVYVNGTYTTA